MSDFDDPVRPASNVPNWHADAMNAPVVQRIREVVKALAAFAIAPRAYAARWATGDATIPNPLFLMATSVAFVSPARHEFDRFVGIEGVTLIQEAIMSVSSYVYYAGIGLVAHAMLRALGPTEPPRASVGISLMVGASVGTFLSLAALASSAALFAVFGTINFADAAVPAHVVALSSLVVELPYFLLLLSMALGLAGVHNVRLWKTALAVFVGVLVCGRLLGASRLVHGVVNFWWTSSGLHITHYGLGL